MGQGLLYFWVSKKHDHLLHVTTKLMGSFPFHGWMDGLTCGLTHPSSCAEALQAGAEVPGRLGPVMWNWEDSVTWGRLPPGWYYLSLGHAQWRVACWLVVMAWLDHGTSRQHICLPCRKWFLKAPIPNLSPTQIECFVIVAPPFQTLSSFKSLRLFTSGHHVPKSSVFQQRPAIT